MKGPLFPTWQVDPREYRAVCAYLGLAPSDTLYGRLLAVLADAAVTHAPLTGLARALALPRLTPFRIARLDLASRLFFPDHPVRHVLNAVIALHECTGDGYRQMSRAATGKAAWFALAGWSLRFALGLAITAPWFALQVGAWLVKRPFAHDFGLAGEKVLITGAGRGLGLDLLLECLERGARVVGVVRTAAARDELRAALPSSAPVEWVLADLAVPGSVTAALDSAGIAPDSLHRAILCAGTKHEGHTVIELDRLRETLQVNLFACAEVAAWLYGDATAPAAPALVVVSSMGRWHGMHSTAGYNASKAALSIWAESLELDLGRRPGMRPVVTVVEPGLFESGMSEPGPGRRLLFAPRRRIAARIIDTTAAGRRSLRPPVWFALLTWAVCLSGRRIRQRLFARAKTGVAP